MFSSIFFRSACAGALLALGGCATPGDVPQQQLEVHAILDHRELTGVGCVLSNSAGRWFVLAPGRVTVQRTRDPLTVDCALHGAGSAQERVEARSGARFDVDKLIGNLIVKTPLDAYYDSRSGTSVAYPAIVTVIMHGVAARGGADAEASPAASGNVVF